MWPELFSDYTVRMVVSGSLVLGVTAGILGCFALLRRQSLLGDAIAHATLPGVCIAYMITGSKAPWVLMLGAAVAGWLGALTITLITEFTRIKRDAALGIVLSVFFGFGLVLITIVQRLPTATKAGLDKFLFGNAATLLKEDVTTMSILCAAIFILVFIYWKEFKLIVFDAAYARSIGLPVGFLDVLLTSLIVAAIVVGLQTVGVVLMSAMLVAPAAAARQWTDRLARMVVLSAFFGAAAGVAGALSSSIVVKLPTGPTIVVFLSFFVFMSLFFAPHRGLLWDFLRDYQNRRKIQTTAMLKNLLLFSEAGTDPFHPHDLAALRAIGRGTLNQTLQELSRKGLVEEKSAHQWALTPQGLEEARRLTQEFEDLIGAGEEHTKQKEMGGEE